MSLIESIRTNRGTASVAGSVLLLVGVLGIWRQVAGGRTAIDAGNAFYTTDEGATLFAESADRIPPFDHDGKEAVRAAVFSCDKGQHRWVAYLFKYSQEGLDAVQTMKAKGAKYIHVPLSTGRVKRPGDKAWIPVSGGRSIMTARCRDGQAGPPLEVRP